MRRVLMLAVLLALVGGYAAAQGFIRYYPAGTAQFEVGAASSDIRYSAQTGCGSLCDGLVSYWSLDETSGNRLDSVGSNDLSITGSVGSATGKNGNAALFEGAGYLGHSSNDDLQVPDDGVFTVAEWVYIDSIAGYNPIFAKWTDYLFRTEGVSGALQPYINSGAVTVPFIGSLSAGQWYYIVAWFDGTDPAKQLHVQIDGWTVHESAASYGASQSAVAFSIGGRADAAEYSNSKIDEVGIWNRVLTASERATLYNYGSGKFYDGTRFSGAAGTPPTEGTTVLAIGDSKTALGTWQSALIALAPPAISADLKVGTATGTDGTLAVAGTTVALMQDRIDNDLAVAAGTVDYVLVNLGVNEGRFGLPTEAAFKADALYIFDALKTKWPAVEIYLMRVWSSDCTDCATVNAWLNDLPAQRDFVHLGPDENVWLEAGDNGATNTIDGVHYSVAGNTACAAAWETVLGW